MATKRKVILRSDPKASTKKFSRLFWQFLLAVFISAIAYILFFSGFLNVTTVNIEGTNQLDTDSVSREVQSILSGKYLKVIDRGNIILVRTSRIAKEMSLIHKQIREVKISKKFPNTLNITIIERKPTLIYCSAGKCFMLDENGQAFDTADPEGNEAQKENLPVFEDLSGQEVRERDQVLTREVLLTILAVKEKLKDETGIETERKIETPALLSDDIRLMTSEGWKIYFSTVIDISKELEMLKVVLDNKIKNEDRANLEYIDLRSDNKVFYKFKQNEQISSETSDQTPLPAEKTDKKDKKKKK